MPGGFATVILLQIDVQSRHLTYASAGHETAWLLAPDGRRRELESTGLILGIDELTSLLTGSNTLWLHFAKERDNSMT